MKQHEGQCNRCQIAWAWTLRITLKDQVCKKCSGPLCRIDRRTAADCGYTWMEWEGYR